MVAAWLLGLVPGGLRQHREVLAAIAVQGSAPSETPPARSNLIERLGPGPLLEGLLADGEQDGATALALGAHDLHAPLVLDAGGIGTRRAEEISVEVGQAVVVALGALDQLAATEPELTASAHAALGAGDGRGCGVLADLAGGRHISAGADPAC